MLKKASKLTNNRRAIVLVVDGCGIGAAPDTEKFGDPANCNSLANTASHVKGLKLPNLARLGLGNIHTIAGVHPTDKSIGMYGKLKELSNGKDTQTGHWEMMGIISKTAFPLYPHGFPDEIIQKFIAETDCKNILCNQPASGTEIIDKMGELHQKTKYPIVYTSGDSVFQIACHVETIPLTTLYKWCEIARNILTGPHRVGRVIARPFTGEPGNYSRLGGDRRDYAVPPPAPTLLDQMFAEGIGVFGIGKIEDIFAKQGLTHAKHTGTNREGMELTLSALRNEIDWQKVAIVDEAPQSVQFIFTNLVDTDMVYGHRRNVEGYAKALEEIDEYVGKIMNAMSANDVLLISSDHGNDPTAPGTDHTREYVPILVYSPSLQGINPKYYNLGERDGFVDMAASIASWFELKWQGEGKTFIPQLSLLRTS